MPADRKAPRGRRHGQVSGQVSGRVSGRVSGLVSGLVSRRLAVLLSVLGSLAFVHLPAGAQASSVAIPLGLHVGIPQGEFAQNVKVAGGFGAGVIWKLGSVVGLRADLGAMLYGSETRRVPLGGGALGLINVDVTTTNSIVGGGIGLQRGPPGTRLTPYVGGAIGFSAFTTSSSVEGSNSSDEPFASSTNYSDGVFAQSAFGGLYLPLGDGAVTFDLGVRHTWNGKKVNYLTKDDITEDAGGDIVLTPRQTRADLLTIVLGVTIRPNMTAR